MSKVSITEHNYTVGSFGKFFKELQTMSDEKSNKTLRQSSADSSFLISFNYASKTVIQKAKYKLFIRQKVMTSTIVHYVLYAMIDKNKENMTVIIMTAETKENIMKMYPKLSIIKNLTILDSDLSFQHSAQTVYHSIDFINSGDCIISDDVSVFEVDKNGFNVCFNNSLAGHMESDFINKYRRSEDNRLSYPTYASKRHDTTSEEILENEEDYNILNRKKDIHEEELWFVSLESPHKNTYTFSVYNWHGSYPKYDDLKNSGYFFQTEQEAWDFCTGLNGVITDYIKHYKNSSTKKRNNFKSKKKN